MNKILLEYCYTKYLHGQDRSKFPGNCYPRTILPPNGYVSPRLYSGLTYAMLDNATTKRDYSEAGEIYLQTKLIELKVPTFFVGSEFLRALVETSPPADTTLKHLHWPLDAMLFVLPEQLAIAYTGYCVPFLAVCKVPVGQHICHSGYQCSNSKEKLSLHFALVLESGIPHDYFGNYDTDLPLSEIESALHKPIRILGETVPEFALSEQDEMRITQRMNSLAVKLLLAMNARPELIEYGAQASPGKVKQSRVIAQPTWHANMLGRTYRIARGEGADGHHLSPRMHWRRGHMRRQKYGRNWSLSKIIWIDPVLVNVENEQEQIA